MSFLSSSTPRRLSRRQDFSTILHRISPHSDSKTCPICLTAISTTKLAILSPCSHAYCTYCIHKWSDVKRTCPLCNSNFDSWLHRFDFRRRTFVRYQPPPLPTKSEALSGFGEAFRRSVRGGREESSRIEYSRSRPLPKRRSFRRSASEEVGQVAERALQWRASIYTEKLRAVPLDLSTTSSRSCPQPSGLRSRDLEERIRRASPWIKRELQAVLDDPDPTVIVHVVTSLYASSLQDNTCADSDFLGPLRPFLPDWTDMFWHELRCFAESSLTMETYDTVVSYERIQR